MEAKHKPGTFGFHSKPDHSLGRKRPDGHPYYVKGYE